MLAKLVTITNTTKANLIAFINALMGLAIAFHVALTPGQEGAVEVTVNALLALLVGISFKQSMKRIQDDPAA